MEVISTKKRQMKMVTQMNNLSCSSGDKTIILNLGLAVFFSLSVGNLYADSLDDKILEEGIGGTGHEGITEVDVPEVPETPANDIPERPMGVATGFGAFDGYVTDAASVSSGSSEINQAIDIDADNNTKFYYASVYLKHKYKDWVYGINVPYLKVRGGAFINTGDQLYAHNNENGLGDISLHISYTPHALSEGKLHIGYSLGIKLPTADEEKGLGSGETDYSFSADLFYRANNITPFFKIGYKVRGDSFVDQLESGMIASLGLDYQFMEKHSFGYMFDYLTARRENESALESSVIYGSFELTQNVSLTTFYQLGHSNSAADKGFGGTLIYKF